MSATAEIRPKRTMMPRHIGIVRKPNSNLRFVHIEGEDIIGHHEEHVKCSV